MPNSRVFRCGRFIWSGGSQQQAAGLVAPAKQAAVTYFSKHGRDSARFGSPVRAVALGRCDCPMQSMANLRPRSRCLLAELGRGSIRTSALGFLFALQLRLVAAAQVAAASGNGAVTMACVPGKDHACYTCHGAAVRARLGLSCDRQPAHVLGGGACLGPHLGDTGPLGCTEDCTDGLCRAAASYAVAFGVVVCG